MNNINLVFRLKTVNLKVNDKVKNGLLLFKELESPLRYHTQRYSDGERFYYSLELMQDIRFDEMYILKFPIEKEAYKQIIERHKEYDNIIKVEVTGCT